MLGFLLRLVRRGEAKNFRARRRRGRPQEATDAGAGRNAGGASII